MNLGAVNIVHLSDNVIERITNDWIARTETAGIVTGIALAYTHFILP